MGQSWWLGGVGPGDNNAGVIVYPPAQQLFGNMTINGFPDQTWYWLIEGAKTFLMEQIPALDPDFPDIEVMIRAVDIFSKSRSKSLLFKMQVGKGTILGCGLRLFGNTTLLPEKSWMLTR